MPVRKGKYKPYGRGKETTLALGPRNQPRSEQLRGAIAPTYYYPGQRPSTSATKPIPAVPTPRKKRKTNRSGGADYTNPGGGGNASGYNNPGKGRGRRGK